jgi:hypothetical protein
VPDVQFGAVGAATSRLRNLDFCPGRRLVPVALMALERAGRTLVLPEERNPADEPAARSSSQAATPTDPPCRFGMFGKRGSEQDGHGVVSHISLFWVPVPGGCERYRMILAAGLMLMAGERAAQR